jgi:putative FmdB family regulatory protein
VLAFSLAVPIYEFKCPEGHVFEVFQRMSDPPPETCAICGRGPVEKVLYPVAVHFKGSGFYSTDYGRGSRKREQAKEDADSGKSDEAGRKDEKKPAEA